MIPPPLILCSGSLGSAPLSEKFEAAAAAGFDGVSVYGHEVRTAIAAGVDCGARLVELGLQVAEVDGDVSSVLSTEGFDAALAVALALGARSITVVETGEYDPADEHHLATAAVVFMLIGQSLRLYQGQRGVRLKPLLVRVWAGWFVGVVPVLLFLLFIAKQSEAYSRVTISSWFVLAPFFICVWRTATTLGLREMRAHGYNTRGAAIIGIFHDHAAREEICNRQLDVTRYTPGMAS